MCGHLLLLATTLLGVDVGWQPLPEGGVQYLIQIEPHVLDTLRAGEAIESEIPPSVEGVRAYRVTVGSGELPRVLPPTPPAEAARPPAEPVQEPITPIGPDLTPSWPPPEIAIPAAPNPLPADPTPRRIGEQPASLVEAIEAPPAVEPVPPPAVTPEPASVPAVVEKAWFPLTLALLLLFASLGGNAYLGWIAAETRLRYRALLERTADAGAVAS